MNDAFKPTATKIILSLILPTLMLSLGFWFGIFIMILDPKGFLPLIVYDIIGYLITLPILPANLAILANNLWPEVAEVLDILGLILSFIWTYFLIGLIILLYRKYYKKGAIKKRY